MQTTGGISGGTLGKINIGTYRKRALPRDREKEESCSTERCCNAFLKQPISIIAPTSVVRSREVDEHNYITRNNYNYLHRCVANYAKLLGVPFNHNSGETIGAGISNLYHELQKIVGDEISINMDICGKRLQFVLWDSYNWGDYSIYFIPVRFIEKLPVTLKRLTISFLHQFIRSMKIDTIISSDMTDWILEWQCETLDDYDDPNDRKAYTNFLSGYKEGGKVYKLMQQIERCNYHKNLRRALARYQPENAYQTKLIDIMTDGLRFIGDNGSTIFDYAYDVFDDEGERDDHPVLLEQMFMFTYADDEISEGINNYLNDVYNNSYGVVPCQTLILTPQTDELFGKESFPEEFFEYMDRLNDFIRINHEQ